MSGDVYGDHQVDAVNAWGDDDGGSVIASLRYDGEFHTFRLSRDDADQLQGMLYLLTKDRD